MLGFISHEKIKKLVKISKKTSSILGLISRAKQTRKRYLHFIFLMLKYNGR